jgi:hypothetical protein
VFETAAMILAFFSAHGAHNAFVAAPGTAS